MSSSQELSMNVRSGTILILISFFLAHASYATKNDITDSAKHEPVTYVFECSTGISFVVRTDNTGVWVFLPGRTLQLPASNSSSIETYRDTEFELQIKAQSALFKKAGKPPLNCFNNRKESVWEHAKLNGADFRAIGNEPAWNLVIQNGSTIVLLADYNTLRVERPLPEPVTDRARRTTLWDTGTLKLEVSGASCFDSMSGDRFESTVVVYWRERVLRGCGRALH
jgi:uncharacterized membrane protein